LRYVPSGLKLKLKKKKKSYILPMSVLKRYVWISGQAAMFSVYTPLTDWF
jgi:hypothetical protein